jgi:NADPH:quinone reductase-like Zn-dependent oxidoreductase
MREGKYPVVTEKDLPYVLGRDVSGEIAAAGDRCLQLPDRRCGLCVSVARTRRYEEFVLALVDEVAAKPKSLDQVGAAAVPLAGITAWQGLFDHGGLRQGQRVLIHGGAGGVGHFAIQFAKGKGCLGRNDRIGVRQRVRQRPRRRSGDRLQVRKVRGPVGLVDLVFDLIGGETQERSFSVVKPGGALISTLQEPDKARALN